MFRIYAHILATVPQKGYILARIVVEWCPPQEYMCVRLRKLQEAQEILLVPTILLETY